MVTVESRWDDEQRQDTLDRLAYAKQIHHACGNHIADSMNPTVSRSTGHQRVVCEDCHAIEHDRKKWHKAQGHPKDGPCPCDDEVFFIERRDPLPPAILRDVIKSNPAAAEWV